eukprot:70422_1
MILLKCFNSLFSFSVDMAPQFICFVVALLLHCICAISRIPIIIDTDIGTDFDDTCAVSYALSRPDVFDIKLILTATFNTTGRAQLVAKYLESTNRTDVDIGIGLFTPWGSRQLIDGVGNQMPWAIDYDLNTYPGKIYSNGIDRAKQILATGTPTNPIYIVEIAPMPNIGVIFTDQPSLKSNTRIVTMAGSIYRGYGSNHAQAEYNIAQNQSAAKIVYNFTDVIPYAYPICAAPLDTTYYFQIYGDAYQEIYNSKLPIPTTFVENYKVWYNPNNRQASINAYRPYSPTTATSIMYDCQAMFMASMIAENSTNGKPADCDTMPFMKLQASNIIVNNTGYTVNDTYNDDKIQIVYEAITWNDGYENGTYPLGQFIANSLITPQ